MAASKAKKPYCDSEVVQHFDPLFNSGIAQTKAKRAMTETIVLPFKQGRRSPKITAEMAAKIKVMLQSGMSQHDIAAHFSVNQGQVSKIKTGSHDLSYVKPAQLELIFQ